MSVTAIILGSAIAAAGGALVYALLQKARERNNPD
jgi:hypothetical protein